MEWIAFKRYGLQVSTFVSEIIMGFGLGPLVQSQTLEEMVNVSSINLTLDVDMINAIGPPHGKDFSAWISRKKEDGLTSVGNSIESM